MPNYEELYYIARGKYYQAIEERNTIRRNTSELQERKSTLFRELGEKQTALSQIQQNKALIQDALNKCRNILNDEFPMMKNDVQCTSEEYKKIITSDKGVVDLSAIYSADITNTNSNLNSIVSDMERILKEIEGQETIAQNDVASCNSELATVTTRLNNVGSEATAQRHINNYYAEMKEYQLRWQNGEQV